MQIDGNKLKMVLIRKCWSVSELARRAEVSPATLSHIINKGGISNTATVGKISRALGIEPPELLKG